MQLQSKWKHTSKKFDVSAPVSHAQLQNGSIKRGAWGPEQGSRSWDELCAPSILLGMLQFVPPLTPNFYVSLAVAQGRGSGSWWIMQY